MHKRVLTGTFAMFAVFAGVAQAGAATITAFEEIGDSTCTATATSLCVDQNRDLYRIRQVGAGPADTENSDAIITGAVGSGGNAVDANFGLYNVLANNVVEDVSYTHVMTWLSDWPVTLATARLDLYSYGASGNNDEVSVESVSLINLSTNSGIQVTQFSNGAVLTQVLDGLLTVTLNKSNQNEINLFKSILTVTYDVREPTGNPVAAPEPASLLLIGTGLACAAAVRRRRSVRR
ncbi:MAG TPA: PEP-CTERM sorting domain-containing protein [Vicinamibacterales bacterium]|nr:PEP-CTERM sorting domain-containing protein [Vicinamibacterales bacterium]